MLDPETINVLVVFHQLRECALFDNCTPQAKSDDVVGCRQMSNRMRANHDCDASPASNTAWSINTTEQLGFCVVIKATQHVVKYHDVGLGVQSAGDRDALLLTTAEHDAVAPDLGVMALRQESNVDAEHGGVDDLVVLFLVKRAVADDVVLEGGVVEERGLLAVSDPEGGEVRLDGPG